MPSNDIKQQYVNDDSVDAIEYVSEMGWTAPFKFSSSFFLLNSTDARNKNFETIFFYWIRQTKTKTIGKQNTNKTLILLIHFSSGILFNILATINYDTQDKKWQICRISQPW